MDFTPHTDQDVARMLAHLGLNDPADLFAHLPDAVRPAVPLDLPDPLSEMEVMAHIERLGCANRSDLITFAGGGIYDHHLPPVVRALTMRPEFVTSYTPYQSEVAQGVLQMLFEYQSMVTALTGLPVANASLYDGPSSGLEAVNLAVAHRRRNLVWISRGVHPHTRQIIRTFAAARHIEVVEHPLVGGRTVWARDMAGDPAAIIVGQPNYLGVVEDYDEVRALADERQALAIAAVDPMLLGVLRSPGDAGFDIAFAEGQPYGNPMSFGGPVLGVFSTSRELLRSLPGRLVGETRDTAGQVAFTLTLRAREQDIRREKASSNICTNQTLNAIAATVHLAWLGPNGLAEVGRQSILKAHHLADALSSIRGVAVANEAPFAREFAITTPMDPREVVERMADHGYLAGIPLDTDYPDLPGGLLIAVTERRTREQLDGYAAALAEVVTHA
jgi:glycine dehydrogenase subunit 1